MQSEGSPPNEKGLPFLEQDLVEIYPSHQKGLPFLEKILIGLLQGFASTHSNNWIPNVHRLTGQSGGFALMQSEGSFKTSEFRPVNLRITSGEFAGDEVFPNFKTPHENLNK